MSKGRDGAAQSQLLFCSWCHWGAQQKEWLDIQIRP